MSGKRNDLSDLIIVLMNDLNVNEQKQVYQFISAEILQKKYNR